MYKKVGLVLEGGGMRGAYTSGVLDAFMDENLKFPYVIGVSAGANNGANFVAEQRERNKEIFVDCVNHEDFSGFKNLIKGKNYFNMDFLFDKVPNELLPFDYFTFLNSQTIFKLVVTDCKTGQPTYFEKFQTKNSDMDFINKALRASSSIPIFAEPVKINGRLYFDGGISDAIPIEKSIEDGNRYNVVVLTRNEDYHKGPQTLGLFAKHYLKKYPKILNAIETKHIKYNIILEKIRDLETEGFVYVFRPIAPLGLYRLEKDRKKSERFYKQGYNEAMEQMNDFKRWLKSTDEILEMGD